MNDFNDKTLRTITHYRLNDGRIWSVAEAKFVSFVKGSDVVFPAEGIKNALTVERLINCLDFYKYPKGELKTDEEYAAEVRAERDRLLVQTDYLAMPDYPLNEDRRAAVLAYRQALRDVPEQAGFPRQIDWPIRP